MRFLLLDGPIKSPIKSGHDISEFLGCPDFCSSYSLSASKWTRAALMDDLIQRMARHRDPVAFQDLSGFMDRALSHDDEAGSRRHSERRKTKISSNALCSAFPEKLRKKWAVCCLTKRDAQPALQSSQSTAQNPGPNGKRIVDAKGPAAMVNHGMVNRSASGFISAHLCLKNSSHGARREPGLLSKRSGELTVRI